MGSDWHILEADRLITVGAPTPDVPQIITFSVSLACPVMDSNTNIFTSFLSLDHWCLLVQIRLHFFHFTICPSRQLIFSHLLTVRPDGSHLLKGGPLL